MENNSLQISLYTIPQAACDEKKANWYDVASLLRSQMENVFKDRVRFSHIEFMSAEWFNDQHAQNPLLKNMVAFPFVLVDGAIASNEKRR
ncbi:MAG: hypothetical protein U5L72_08030 [Bacteroidales bacterium]|nr:hypothetical protein [Bacteroidales bacterium]